MEFHNLDNTKAIEFAPGAKVKFVHSENMTVAMWELDAGLDVPAHSHHHEQIVLLLEGEFEITVDGEKMPMAPNEVCVIPSNVPHGGKPITACKLQEIYYPVRKDFLRVSEQNKEKP